MTTLSSSSQAITFYSPDFHIWRYRDFVLRYLLHFPAHR